MKNQNSSENLINRDFSRRITCLRFILAVLVVFIHSKFDQSTVDFADGSMQISVPLYVNIIQTIFTNVLGRCRSSSVLCNFGVSVFRKAKKCKGKRKIQIQIDCRSLHFLDGSDNFSFFCRAELFVFKKLFFKAGKHNPLLEFF